MKKGIKKIKEYHNYLIDKNQQLKNDNISYLEIIKKCNIGIERLNKKVKFLYAIITFETIINAILLIF